MDNLSVNRYITRKAISSKTTALHYTRRLNVFANFVSQKYGLTLDELVKTLTTHSHGPKIDVYELLSEYVSYIQEQKDVSPCPKRRIKKAKQVKEMTDRVLFTISAIA